MRIFLAVLIAIFFSTDALVAQEKRPFVIYDKKGEEMDYGRMLERVAHADIILFGEAHNSSLVHWLQYELLSDLYVKERELAIGMEMFSVDQQTALDEHLSGKTDLKQLQEAIELWPNFPTDYQQILTFARENKLRLIGTNAPQKIASNVYKKGGFAYLDELSDEQLSKLPPRPIPFDPELPGYRKMKKMMGVHANDDIIKAQALKDASMAYQLSQLSAEKELILHLNGKYHSDNFEGIFWYLQQYRPELKVQTISMVNQADILTLEEEHQDKADFIICIDENMIKTY